MKKILAMASLLTVLAASAHAQDPMGGLGFRNSGGATVGLRQWFSEKMGVDAGIGFATLNAEINGTKVQENTGFAFDLGLPISLKSWDKVNFIFRPGFGFETTTLKDKTTPIPPNEDKFTQYAVSGELEVEWMIAEKVSISAAHGIAYNSLTIEDNDSPVNEQKITGFNTTGSNFTQLGFHIYLW